MVTKRQLDEMKYFRIRSPENASTPPAEFKTFGSQAPNLVHSFSAALPLSREHSIHSIMIEKSDNCSQTELPLDRKSFENLSEYQKWVDEDVEPFLKVEI